MKKAILQVADTGPLESLVIMLKEAGYDCFLPDEQLRRQLRTWGLDTVLDIEGLVRGWGYEEPRPLPFARFDDLFRADLYVDVKAHRNGPRLWRHVPTLKDKTLWYRINGGKPEHVIKGGATCTRCDGLGKVVEGFEGAIPCYRGTDNLRTVYWCAACNGVGKIGGEDCGDEVDPPCPVLTPNMWYKAKTFDEMSTNRDEVKGCPIAPPFADKAYSCWPPFARIGDHLHPREKMSRNSTWGNPICLVHNLEGWGYGRLIEAARSLGVRCHGAGSPDGLVNHREVPTLLSRCLCMVHLKSSDAPGYALLEALESACPVVCTRRLIWRNRMEELLIPGETCLAFDRETHDALSDEDVRSCTEELKHHLTQLADLEVNRQIGEAGRRKLLELMWTKERDGAGFKAWMEKMFP